MNFYKNKNVFITGHTGFKGAWLTKLLLMAGARVTGYALNPPTEPSLFQMLGLEREINSITADIRDFDTLKKCVDAARPEIIFHLAAQPIVRAGYAEPRYTFETNVMGTVNILECARGVGARSVLNVTTDKVYRSNENGTAIREDGALGGSDPYSGSKSCSELVTLCYKSSFLGDTAVSTARAGNAIGGGDFAVGRIIPDCVRAAISEGKIGVLNPHSVRPYQHVLELLNAYLMIAERQYRDISYEGCYNIAPDADECAETGELVEMFCREWGGISWECISEKNAPRETNILRLDCEKFKSKFGWKQRWDIREAVSRTVEWTKAYIDGDIRTVTEGQIKDFYALKF